jgi:hypothetical protein
VKSRGLTELQQLQQAIQDVILDAREVLDEHAFRFFVDFLIELVAREATRCARWEERQRA